jgi:hypothetical protein
MLRMYSSRGDETNIPGTARRSNSSSRLARSMLFSPPSNLIKIRSFDLLDLFSLPYRAGSACYIRAFTTGLKILYIFVVLTLSLSSLFVCYLWIFLLSPVPPFLFSRPVPRPENICSTHPSHSESMYLPSTRKRSTLFPVFPSFTLVFWLTFWQF